MQNIKVDESKTETLAQEVDTDSTVAIERSEAKALECEMVNIGTCPIQLADREIFKANKSDPRDPKQSADEAESHLTLESENSRCQMLASTMQNIKVDKSVPETIVSTVRSESSYSSYSMENIKADKPKPEMSVETDSVVATKASQSKCRSRLAEELKPEIPADDMLIATEVSESKRLAFIMKDKSFPLDPPQNKVFQIHTEPVEISGAKLIKRFEIGEYKQSHKHPRHKVLMVMGATGAGKSTLINGMVNYIFGVEWEDDFRFKLIIEDAENQLESVTQYITAYTIHPMEGSRVDYTFTIIDTPGFGDTRGMERDEEITKQVQELFSLGGGEGIEHLDAVGFVTQSATMRLTPAQKYVFESILKIFGNDVKHNILTLVTFCDGKDPPVIQAVKAEIPCDLFFKFNNSALYAYACDNDMFDETFWKMGEISFHTFFTEFSAKKSVSIILSKQVLENREKLEELLSKIHVQVETCLDEIEDLRQHKIVLQEHQAQIDANRDFEYDIEVPSVKAVKVQPGKFAFNCLNCNHTCHYPCDEKKKWKCKAMDGGGEMSARCKRCKGKCLWQQHEISTERYEIVYKIETRSYDDLKRKFYEASKGRITSSKLIEKHGRDLERAQTELHLLLEEAGRCMDLLKEIALKPSPLTHADYIQMVINSEINQKKAGWKSRVAHLTKAKEKAVLRDNLVRHGRKSIDESIKAEMEAKEPGYEDRVEELEKLKCIDTAADEHKTRRIFFSRVSEGLREIKHGVKVIMGKK